MTSQVNVIGSVDWVDGRRPTRTAGVRLLIPQQMIYLHCTVQYQYFELCSTVPGTLE